MGMALDSLDVSEGGTYVSLTPFHIGDARSDGGHDIHNLTSEKWSIHKKQTVVSYDQTIL